MTYFRIKPKWRETGRTAPPATEPLRKYHGTQAGNKDSFKNDVWGRIGSGGWIYLQQGRRFTTNWIMDTKLP